MDSDRGRSTGVPTAEDRAATAGGMQKNCRQPVCAYVRLDNLGATRLYEQEGYVRLGVWMKYYSDGGDALLVDKIR